MMNMMVGSLNRSPLQPITYFDDYDDHEKPPFEEMGMPTEDPTERRNLAAHNPEKVAAFGKLLNEHNARQSEPAWPALLESPIFIDKTVDLPYAEGDEYIPYFIQLWGEVLWDVAKEKALQKLTSQEVTMAKTRVESVRLGFYEQRRATLDDLGLLPAAIAIASVFQDTETITRDVLKEIVADSLPADSFATQSVNKHLRTLVRHEFIWNPPDSILYEAGIPSLMAYVLDRQHPPG